MIARVLKSLQLYVVLLSALVSARLATAATPIGDWVHGTASFYGGPQDATSNAYKLTLDSGSCGYGTLDPRLYPGYNVVGVHRSNPLAQERPQSGCGSCLEIECTSGPEVCYQGHKPVQVIVTDECVQECNSTNINMNVFSFEELAPLKFGRVGIRYRLVDCEPADPIAIHVADYRATLGGWIRLSIKNAAGDAGITSVEIGAAGSNVNAAPGQGGWVLMDNTFGAVWEASRLPEPPMDIRIENSIMQTVVVKNAVATAGVTGDVETTAQFPMPTANLTVTAAAAPTVIVGQGVDTTVAASDSVLSTSNAAAVTLPGSQGAQESNASNFVTQAAARSSASASSRRILAQSFAAQRAVRDKLLNGGRRLLV